MSKQETADEYLARKSQAPLGNLDDVYRFFMEYGGNPDQKFVAGIKANPEMLEQYRRDLADALSSEPCKEDFFSLTGKVLVIKPADIDTWANQIVELVISQNPTLQ